MCFIISIVGLVLGFNFYNAGNYLQATGSLIVSAIFIFLMIRNIQSVKKLKKEEKNDN
jgi:large-conductance mechanosensitive channel